MSSFLSNIAIFLKNKNDFSIEEQQTIKKSLLEQCEENIKTATKPLVNIIDKINE